MFKQQNSKSMKTISCRNIERFVLNHNKQVVRLQESSNIRSELDLQCILGTNSQQIKGSVTFALNNEEVIYYSSEYFIVHNLLTKESSIIRKQGSFNHKTIYIDKFQTEMKNDIIFTIEKSNSHLFVGQLEITGNITETNGTQSHSDMKNFNWRLSKLSNKFTHDIEKLSYHPSKHYLYILTSKKKEDKVEKSLWVYDIKRECILMSPEIKPSVSKVEINSLWVTEDPSEIYLTGKNYFRFWTISFNEKSLKQSNYRNIERCLSSKKIIRMFYCHTQNGKMLAVLTEVDLILLKRNQLASCEKPPINSIKKAKSKANIEVELENSLNQIYRMKFMFDDEENQNKVVEEFQLTPQHVEEQNNHFYCASELWNSEGVDCLAVATKIGNLLTYSLANGQMKLLSQLIVNKNHSFDFMTASKKGEVILLSERNCQNLYIINKYSLNSEETQEELKQFWGAGHLNKENLVSISSPVIHQRVCTLGENATMRLWSFKGKERKIIFEEKMMNQPTQLVMHPCGLLVAVNYAKEIKLMSLLPTGLYEVMSAKTNYNSIGLKYSECGNFLVSNQENLLMFYNPFSLKTLGYLEPPELKSTIIDFQITPQGKFISFLTTDFGFYILPLDLANYSKYENIQPSHTQRQAYTCFFFQSGIMRSCKGSEQIKEEDLFIGSSEHKYMVLYKNQGKTLINEFPIQDCYITCFCIADGWLFAATSKKSIRVYKWPIFQQECEMEIISLQNKTIKFKPPRCDEYFFWGDGKKILKIHKLGFSNKLVVAKEGGIMSVITYNKSATSDKTDQPERKKLMLVVNDSYFITKNESEKRNRLIEKTEGDILKVENQIAKEKSIMQRKYKEECLQIEKTYQEKSDIHLQEKNDYLTKMKMEIDNLNIEIANKKKDYLQKNENVIKIYGIKKDYEDGRNNTVQKSILETMTTHRQKMKNLIQSHKEEIRSIKNSYREKIIIMRKEFQNMVACEYPHLITKHKINASESQQRRNKQSRTSIKVKEHLQKDIAFEPLNEQQINTLTIKVEEVKKNNEELANHLQEFKNKVRCAEVEDQNMQKDFQRYLEEYNSNRFSNLSLHSQVLKMRTQLVERKEIMQNKQEIINVAFQERQKLQNYKELVRGSLTKLQDRKQQSHHLFVDKENQLTLIFQQLTTNINELQTIKREDKRVEELTQVILNEKKKNSNSIEEMISCLKELKRYLLLEGLTEDAEQKKLYVQQENLLTTINFYKKRMSMQFLKEKKNKVLKKSALNLVLKQNKNLLEECNQLRQETIEYQHEIKNLGRKLGEAKKIISIESKLKDQKSEVVEQRNQLQAIRALFNDQIMTYQEDPIDVL